MQFSLIERLEYNHPARYRDCEVIKVLQKLRDKKNKSKQQSKTNKVRIVQTSELKNTQNYRKSYSQVISNNTSEGKTYFKHRKYVSTNNANAKRLTSACQQN
jgi:hypothetical protein